MEKTLEQWLSWMESIHPSEIDLGLDRVAEVAKRLQLTGDAATVITVAGTNGKGSCVATLERVLIDVSASVDDELSQDANKNTLTSGLNTNSEHRLLVGSFTSPHLIRYNERIKINGAPVSDQCLCEAFSAIDQARGEITLTYFEFGALAAIYIFTQQSVSYWILEVGLGGRLDAVNIIDPDVAVITSIALDHMDWLGNSRDQIALEKAGILREGIAVVCADSNPPNALLERFKTLKCDSFFIDQDYKLLSTDNGFDLYTNAYPKAVSGLPSCEPAMNNLPEPKLAKESVAAAMQVLRILDVKVGEHLLRRSFKFLKLAGRFEERTYDGRECILDVAHNPAATKRLADRLAHTLAGRHGENVTRCFIVMGMMQDKQLKESIQPLIAKLDKYIGGWKLCNILGNQRAASNTLLSDVLMHEKVSDDKFECCESVKEGIESAISQSQSGDIILIFGSFFTLAEAYQLFKQTVIV